MTDNPDIQIQSKYAALRGLGFSQTAVNCYEMLFEKGGANAQQLAERLGKPHASNLYKLFKQLEAKGLVEAVKTEAQPTYFYAQPIEKALRQYIDYQWRVLEGLIKHQDAELSRRSGRPRHYLGRPTSL